jgi:hypothetical protein
MTRRSRKNAYVALADDILRESREELARADGKSALLLAAAGVVVGAVLSALIAGSWRPANLILCAQLVWWLAIVTGGAGIVALAYAVYPRTRYRGQRPPAVIGFYGDVVSTSDRDLRARLKFTAASDGDRVVDQLRVVATLVDKKYRGIQAGLWLFGASVTLVAASLLIDALSSV